MPPKFIYFDLGKVLLDFSFERMCGQIGEAAGIPPQQVKDVMGANLQADYEAGKLDSRGFYEQFCRATGTLPGIRRLFPRVQRDLYADHVDAAGRGRALSGRATGSACSPIRASAIGTIACGACGMLRDLFLGLMP